MKKFINVLCFSLCLVSCRGVLGDILKSREQEIETGITIPAFGGSSSVETCSIYALLCSDEVDLSVELLKRMLIDGYTRTEHEDFKNAHKLRTQ